MERPPRDEIRKAFPALAEPLVFLENAGGSQVPAVVADAIRDYMTTSYVQLGAGYPLSDFCTELVNRAHDFASLLANGTRDGVAILGSSCTQLVMTIARAYGKTLRRGDEVVVMESGHEANVGPWAELAERGATIRTWRFDPDAMACPLENLDDVLSDRTRIVAVVHASNLLGAVVDVAAVAKKAHAVGARIVVDGVAFAPHRAIDVEALGADYYVWSAYKVYGPHLGAMVARAEALDEIDGPNHFFIPRDEIPYRFEPGGVSHEACAGLLAVGSYLRWLAGRHPGAPVDRALIEDAFAYAADLERPLVARLLGWLRDRPGVRVIGPAAAGPDRLPTVSFVHERKSSREIVAEVHAADVAVRHGHMYAYRLMEPLGLDPADGVVRASAVHYNTVGEIDRLIAALERVI